MNHSNKIAADKTSLGFEFQDFVYVEYLIRLKPGEVLGLELLDDIHVETAAEDGSIDELLLIQVKHSVNPGNITDRDVDLWKTLYNWLKLVPELPPHRKLTLQLYTNKELNSQVFINLLKKPRQNVQRIIEHIRETEKSVSKAESLKKPGDSPNPIAQFVSFVAGSSDDQLKLIFDSFEFHSDSSAIIGRLSSALTQLAIPASRLDDTRKHVIGAFKESKFSKIVQGQKVTISFDDFRNVMGFNRIVTSARADPVDFDRFVDIYYSYQRPDKISFLGSNFHKQLKDIGVGEEEIIGRGVEMILAEDFMEALQTDGLFSASENARLENKAHSEWEVLHEQLHRQTDINDDPKHQTASQECYGKTMLATLKAGGVELPRKLICGKYIKLSNVPRIGWRKDWKNRFEE